MTGGKDIHNGEEQGKQKSWDTVLAEQHQRKLLSEWNQFARTRLLSTSASESAAWLHAISVATLGTLLDPETLRGAIALRVGADVCSPHRCRCGSLADRQGCHALTCNFSAGRHQRHAALNDIVRRQIVRLRETAWSRRSQRKRSERLADDRLSRPASNGPAQNCVNGQADVPTARRSHCLRDLILNAMNVIQSQQPPPPTCPPPSQN